MTSLFFIYFFYLSCIAALKITSFCKKGKKKSFKTIERKCLKRHCYLFYFSKKWCVRIWRSKKIPQDKCWWNFRKIYWNCFKSQCNINSDSGSISRECDNMHCSSSFEARTKYYVDILSNIFTRHLNFHLMLLRLVVYQNEL